MPFKANGIRLSSKKFGTEDIITLREDWKEFAKKIPKYKNKFKGKGIVYTAGGLRYTTCAIVSISMLRETGCKLPVELWYLGNELSQDVIETFKSLDVVCRNFLEIGKVNLTGYMLKPLAIINSSFEEVLFIDADNNCVSDPTDLFDCAQYLESGALFWPDYWKTSKNNSIWSIIDTKTYDVPEQESGQIIVNKRKCWKELELCLHFNKLGMYYYQIIHGDKDTFKFAWLALKSPFNMIQYPVGSCGYMLGGYFFGTTMVQHHPNGKVLFLHRNLLKWDVTKEDEYSWEIIKTFKVNTKNKRILLKDSPEGHLAVDIEGEISVYDFNECFGDYESKCLAFLKKWKDSVVYKDFLEYSHFSANRYSSGIPFSLKVEEDVSLHPI